MSEKMQKMGLIGAISLTVGLVIGSAIFVLLPEITGMAGGSVWLVYILSGIPTFVAAFYLIQMGGALPVSGAHYVGVTKWVNPVFGFVTVFSGLICILSVTPLVSMGFGEYLQSYFPAVNAKLIAIVLIGLFCLINYFGVKLFNAIQISMFIVLLLAIIIYIFKGIPSGNPLTRMPFMPNGIESFIIAIAIASNSWLGIVGVTEIAGVVRNPKRNIPLAIVISVLIITFLYGGMAYAFSGIMGFEKAAEIGSSAVLVAAKSFLSGPVVIFIAIGAMLAMATSINAFIMLAINIIAPMCNNKIFPADFMKKNRFKTPGKAILTFFLLSILLILIFGSKLSSYAIISMVGLMFMEFGGALGVLRMPGKTPELFEKSVFKFPLIIRWLVFVVAAVVFWLMIGFGFLADWKVSLMFFIIAFLSFIYWVIRSAYLKKSGDGLSEIVMKKNDEIIMNCLNIKTGEVE